MANKNVLVTGAAGFIGSNLVDRLLKEGFEVTGIDNLSQGSRRNLEDALRNPAFNLVEGDVRNLEVIEKAGKGADFFVHLAAFKIPRYGNAMDTLQINSKGTENILEAAKETKAKVVFASTSDVYGKNRELPFSEESSLVIGPPNVKRWAYAASKIFDEQLCFAYNEKFGLPFSIVRYFGGYGPRQHLSWWGGPQSVFIEKILKGEKVPVHGDGKQKRSFTFIDDLVEGTFLAMKSGRANGEVLNIGSREESSILGLAKMIAKLMGKEKELEIEFVPYETFGKYEDVRRRVPYTTKAKKLIGFEAKVKLVEGLKKTIGWQEAVMGHVKKN
ncbi:MAG: NAD-dependent epimerase/dehydratase family protein [Candidatus Diapherotrites archaeon]|uniref:NAD-dependent epimerase/dehydratase family protein n=1 Tax=Candidatus Iainarchaeum sp. TaxID=3101447 RepID=A0A7J4IT44_9ARCH|nr:MAG: UDP-glucose 4-epimerase [archaeon GW2011_AR10]MBS3058939.1 NAD-dependent epimerase/dehydratase family protein [Candidatus Diapherotrites archaeon]HIH08632.1 NAD-dependent epimerase/dehydratase family protein [Candidatus Diapherotrites archaeon]